MTDVNIQHFKGESFKLENFKIEDPDGNPIDLTDPSVQDAHFVVSTGTHKYGEVQFDKSGTDLDSNGNVDFTIKAGDTENLRAGNYIYEIYVEYDNKKNYTAEVGKYFLKKRVDK